MNFFVKKSTTPLTAILDALCNVPTTLTHSSGTTEVRKRFEAKVNARTKKPVLLAMSYNILKKKPERPVARRFFCISKLLIVKG